uniref:Glycerol-3-phosphate dehydrogenase [NAD(+)] n=1 Tax=Trichobilharzia regenti TaxID=157069 RepID=A0AA85J5Z1_TRIRE|nr:unnamed protein product [Trichobilharzia regenti]
MVKRVVVLGCGAWGTATVKLVADNVKSSKEFHEEVYWYVRDEDCNGRSLTTWINQEHINPKYLPTLDIPSNVSASSNIQKVVEEADIILVSYPSCYILWLVENVKKFIKDGAYFVSFCKKVVEEADIILVSYPSCYILWLVENVKKFIKDGAYFVSFCKGLILCPEENRIKLVSDVIREQTGKSCVVVIGATTAVEVAKQHFTEATIGSKNLTYAHEVKRLLQSDYLKLVITQDDVGVELCGALKNVVAIAAGICHGLDLGDNTKAAVLRIGFWEVSELMKELFPDRGMSYRSDEIPDIGADLDILNITYGRRLSLSDTVKSSLHPVSSKDLHRIFVDGVEYAKQRCGV